MTPAQELRAAAERLREAANDAFGVWAATYVAPEAAAWAHMVSPAIAEPLADLLDTIADPTAGPLFRKALALVKALTPSNPGGET